MKYSQTDRWAQFEVLPRPLAGNVSTPPNLVFPEPHQHEWAQLSYATEGHLEVWTAEARFIALPRRGVWIPPGIRHQVKRPPTASVRSLYIDTGFFNIDWSRCSVLAIPPLLHELIREFCLSPPDYQPDSNEERLARVLIDRLKQCREVSLVLPWPTDPQLAKICRQLQEDPASNPGLDKLASQLGVSSKTLTRRFQQETGLGYRLWRQRARLIHALPLLEQGQRITDVALSCGYDSLSTFIAVFKDYTGMTPGEFAREATAMTVPARGLDSGDRASL